MHCELCNVLVISSYHSIRLSLESALGRQLSEFKSLIDEEILLILGQMDPASR